MDGFRRQFGLQAPNYLNIAVDSTETGILVGVAEILRDPHLRSVLIELEAADTARNRRLVAAAEVAGFALSLRSRDAQTDVVNGVFTRISVSADARARALG